MTTIMDGPATIELDGEQYTLRRLSVRDAFALGKIVSKAMHQTGSMLNAEMSQEVVAMLVFTALPYAEKETYELCGSVMGVSAEEFANLPPDALPLLLDAVAEHQDLERFFSVCSKVWGDSSNLKRMWNRLSNNL